jgi:hypothetical protein
VEPLVDAASSLAASLSASSSAQEEETSLSSDRQLIGKQDKASATHENDSSHFALNNDSILARIEQQQGVGHQRSASISTRTRNRRTKVEKKKMLSPPRGVFHWQDRLLAWSSAKTTAIGYNFGFYQSRRDLSLSSNVVFDIQPFFPLKRTFRKLYSRFLGRWMEAREGSKRSSESSIDEATGVNTVAVDKEDVLEARRSTSSGMLPEDASERSLLLSRNSSLDDVRKGQRSAHTPLGLKGEQLLAPTSSSSSSSPSSSSSSTVPADSSVSSSIDGAESVEGESVEIESGSLEFGIDGDEGEEGGEDGEEGDEGDENIDGDAEHAAVGNATTASVPVISGNSGVVRTAVYPSMRNNSTRDMRIHRRRRSGKNRRKPAAAVVGTTSVGVRHNPTMVGGAAGVSGFTGSNPTSTSGDRHRRGGIVGDSNNRVDSSDLKDS